MLLDGDKLQQSELKSEICIIGAGAAGISLATKLAENGRDVIVVESGGKFAEPLINKLNQFQVESNFVFRKNQPNRFRQVGGSTNLWPGRVVHYRFDDRLDTEWGDFHSILPRYYKEADRFFGIPETLVSEFKDEKELLTAYWAPSIQRFNYKSDFVKNAKFSVVYHLNFCGQAVFEQSRLLRMEFKSHKGKTITIKADRFVLATGGIENSRILLMMRADLEKRSGMACRNIGQYIMDHPKITEGRLRLNKSDQDFRKYHLRVVRWGKVKYGIRNKSESTRVYCNLLESRSKRIEKWYARAAEFYKQLTGKKPLNANGDDESEIIEDLIYLLEPAEFVPHWVARLNEISHVHKTTGKYKIVTYLEQRPRFENSIGLDDNRFDYFHRPLPLIKTHIHSSEVEEVERFYKFLEKRFAKDGMSFEYDTRRLKDTGQFTEASHHLGGTRYSVDRDRAVIDRDLRVIGMDNLHIAGSSVFPSGGVENPTHLIVSVSCYLADVILNY